MKSLNYADLIAKFEDQANTPDRERPSCDCDYCQQDRNTRPCRVSGGYCEAGWHFRTVTTSYGYDAETAFEPCPFAARTKLEKIREQIEARKVDNARRLMAQQIEGEEIVRKADELRKQMEAGR